MVAPVTMNSTLDNARVLGPLLKFTFKKWDVTHFVIFDDNKKIISISTTFLFSFYNLSCYSDFSLCSFHTYVYKFSFISSFVFTSHKSFTSFSIEIWSLICEMYFKRKNFYQKSGKNFFFWNTFMIVDWKISFTFRSCIHVLNVERKLSKEKINHLWKKNFIV